jgi:hypothetical protein
MAEAFVNVTEGSGKKLHGWDRTIGANTVVDEFTLPGEYPMGTYTISAAAIATTTAASHLLQIMAGASLNVRVRRIFLSQNAAPGSVSICPLQIVRVTTAGTGGGAITARPFDNADAAAGAGGLTLNTVKGTEGNILWDQTIWLGTGAIPIVSPFVWTQMPNSKPIIIPAGVANGIVIKNTLGIATSTVDITVELVETAFV